MFVIGGTTSLGSVSMFAGETGGHVETATQVDGDVSGNHDNICGASSSIIFDKRVNIRASRVMLAMLREQPLGGGTSKFIPPTDNVIIKMCDVKLQLKTDSTTAPSGGVLAGRSRRHRIVQRC